MICARCYDISENVGAHCGMCGGSPLLEGRYRLEAQVGQGASARTYRAVRVADGQVADSWGRIAGGRASRSWRSRSCGSIGLMS